MESATAELTERNEAAPRHRRRRWWIAGGVLALLIALAVAVVVTWNFSSVVLVPNHQDWPQEVKVENVEPGDITLSSGHNSEQPGVYGLDWQTGHAIVGPVLSEGDGTVTRRLSDVRGYLVPGIHVGLDSHVYTGDPAQALGLPFRSVGVPDPLGPMPAWLVPAAAKSPTAGRRTWAIVVHGHNDDRQNDLRIVPTLRQAGLASLLISYRNDLGAPESPDGLYHLGETEWIDLQTAVHYALAHGAQRVVLFGYSMGGELVTQFMQRSRLSRDVSALILDAPVLDWRSLIEFNSEQIGLPGFLGSPVEWMIDARVNPDWDSLDALEHPEDFHRPILLFHSTEDELVPISTSDKFAAELPRWVTYYRVPTVGHTESWNLNPHLYDHRLRQFLMNHRSPRQS
ncbi:MAG TPA: alpha/beta hydrolase [Solirubrobacterales bacterium]|nr:alpha/beta hydrolase [Solirubrobacterales bacterium]